MKTLTCYCIGLAIITLAACKKQSETASFEKQLIGKWRYTGQSGGFNYQYYPADPSVKTVLEFQRNKIFVTTENNQTTDEGPYDIIRVNSIYTGKEDHAIRFHVTTDSPESGEIVAIRKDTLNIGDNSYDGFTKSYVRVK